MAGELPLAPVEDGDALGDLGAIAQGMADALVKNWWAAHVRAAECPSQAAQAALTQRITALVLSLMVTLGCECDCEPDPCRPSQELPS